MKTLIPFVAAIFISTIAFAQTPQLPTGKPQLPAPKNLKVVTKPDLVITNASVVSATGWTDKWDIRLSVTIKNNGGLAAKTCTIKAFVQDAANASNPWKNFIDLPAVIAVNPGQSLTTEIRFLDKAWVMHKIKTINLKLKADAANVVDESNETNNESSVIQITSN